MEAEKILDRIWSVYQESVRLSNLNNQDMEDKKPVNIYNHPNLHSYIPEIDGNYLLFFNKIYTTPVRKWLKKILKSLTWSILKRQVYFNTAIKKLLYDFIQKSYEDFAKDREVSKKFSLLEQKIELLPLLEQKIELLPLLEQKIELLPQLEQKIELLSQLEQKIELLSQLESKLEDKVEQIFSKLEIDNSLPSKVASVDEARIGSELWFNEPIIVGYRENGEAYWAGTNERIFEKSFVLQSLSRLYDSSNITVLDVGAAESLLAYELACLNYSVTAIDIRPIGLSHPNLKFVKSDICKPVIPPASFDCVVALSTLEHIGLGWYGDETGETFDCEAVKQIHILLKPRGSFILTVPYGKKAVTPVHRIYDKESLHTLIQGFDISLAVYGVRLDDFTWTMTDDEVEASLKEHNPHNYLPGAVAMLVCKKPV
ncbi:MAG: DUF268 domain-containing protein [Stigonema ocellatum SAG 48.90 = DSM 106950]|nr:DUF268 domain-containing protein [Stigonema ocellatum SAG 48.90 = DSM 106950]